MEPFSILKDTDIFDNPAPQPQEYITRPTAKGIVLDKDKNIAFVTGPHYGYSLLPGGGVEKGETFEQAFIRECVEEIGCNVSVISKLGEALQFRAKSSLKYEVHFFVATVIGEKGVPTSVQQDEQGVKVLWLSQEEALKVFETNFSYLTDTMYVPYFNCQTQLVAFKKFLELELGAKE